MSGGVIARPAAAHHCAPGLRWAEFGGDPVDGMPRAELGLRYAILPTARAYPAGTVWRCDCGRVWVSRGAIYVNEPGGCYWRRERWWERRRREREVR